MASKYTISNNEYEAGMIREAARLDLLEHDNRPSALTKTERQEWIDLNEKEAEAVVGRAVFSKADRKRMMALTRRMKANN